MNWMNDTRFWSIPFVELRAPPKHGMIYGCTFDAPATVCFAFAAHKVDFPSIMQRSKYFLAGAGTVFLQ